MENDKKWEKPEITILFSGNVSEDVMSNSDERPAEEYTP